MELFHISDLHLGKRVNGFSMIEEQKDILCQILQMVQDKKPQAVLLTGDIYDKTIPPQEAVGLLDSFLTDLSKEKVQVFLISGNHDSPERLDFGSRIFENNGIYFESIFRGNLRKVTISDTWGPVHFYLLPFVKPSIVNVFTEQPVESYQEALELILHTASIDTKERNVLLAHQYVTHQNNALCCDSETISLGGLDNIESSAFWDFDYVALGHLHSPQKIGREWVRYAGSPLQYSFSEIHQKKSVTWVRLGEKGDVQIQLLPLCPKRKLRQVVGTLEEVCKEPILGEGSIEDYVQILLTDTKLLYDPIGKLRQYYPNLMAMEFIQQESMREGTNKYLAEDFVSRSPEEHFSHFFIEQYGRAMTKDEEDAFSLVIKEMDVDRQ